MPSEENHRPTSAWIKWNIRLMDRDGNFCRYCGLDFDRKWTPEWNAKKTIDHIQPKVGGGCRTLGNSCLACKWCNNHKGKQSVKEFKRYPKLLARIERVREVQGE